MSSRRHSLTGSGKNSSACGQERRSHDGDDSNRSCEVHHRDGLQTSRCEKRPDTVGLVPLSPSTDQFMAYMPNTALFLSLTI